MGHRAWVSRNHKNIGYPHPHKSQLGDRMQRKGNPSALLVGMQTNAATVENSVEFPQRTKYGTAFGTAIPLLFGVVYGSI